MPNIKPNEEWVKEFDNIPQPDKIQMHKGFTDRDMIDFCQDVVKPFIRTILSLSHTADRQKLREKIDEMSYVGVLDNNEKRRGYDIARQEFISLINEENG